MVVVSGIVGFLMDREIVITDATGIWLMPGLFMLTTGIPIPEVWPVLVSFRYVLGVRIGVGGVLGNLVVVHLILRVIMVVIIRGMAMRIVIKGYTIVMWTVMVCVWNVVRFGNIILIGTTSCFLFVKITLCGRICWLALFFLYRVRGQRMERVSVVFLDGAFVDLRWIVPGGIVVQLMNLVCFLVSRYRALDMVRVVAIPRIPWSVSVLACGPMGLRTEVVDLTGVCAISVFTVRWEGIMVVLVISVVALLGGVVMGSLWVCGARLVFPLGLALIRENLRQ